MSSGSLELEFHGRYVDSVIARERKQYPARRQVEASLVFSKKRQGLFMYQPDGAYKDGRLNWAPPQGEIQEGESLEDAVRREASEEFALSLGPVTYLGSVMRQFRPGHPKAKMFDSATYHWTCAIADCYTFIPEFGVAKAGWHHAPGLLNWCCERMSPDKAAMFKAAMARAIEGPLFKVPVWQHAFI